MNRVLTHLLWVEVTIPESDFAGNITVCRGTAQNLYCKNKRTGQTHSHSINGDKAT